MKLPQPELIVIDLDGTLIDSAPDLAYALEGMLRPLQEQLPPVAHDPQRGDPDPPQPAR